DCVSASAVKSPISPFAPRELDEAGIEKQIHDIATAAARAREAGYELRVSLEAEIAFAQRTGKRQRRLLPARPTHAARHEAMTDNDRRFLRSLRIAPDTQTEEVE
ncbi:MAG: hypothetical protein ACLGHP_05380, partial [Vicinamibacteria bacterium]